MKLETVTPEEVLETNRKNNLIRTLVQLVKQAMPFRNISKDSYDDIYDAAGDAIRLLFQEDWDWAVTNYRQEMETVAKVIYYGA